MLNLLDLTVHTGNSNDDHSSPSTSLICEDVVKESSTVIADIDNVQSDLSDNHSSPSTLLVPKEDMVNKISSMTIVQPDKENNIINKHYNLREAPNKDYQENENDREDFSPDCSEYNPSCEASSRPQSTASSVEDLSYINQYLDSKINSPAAISNLSGLLDNVDFVASPTAIFKTNRTTPSSLQKGQSIEFTRVLSHNEIFLSEKHRNQYSTDSTSSSLLCINTEEIIQNETQTVNNINKPMTHNNTLTAMEVVENITENNDENQSDKTLESASNFGHVEISDTVNIITEVEHFPVVPTSIMASETDGSITEDCSAAKAKKLTRKRSCNRSEWCDNKNKILKNSGQAYEGVRSKKRYDAKTIGPSCKCQKKCGDKFTMQQRQMIFNNFYRLKDHEIQWHYIVRHVEANPVKRITLDRKNNRTQTIKYFFDLAGDKISVCKQFFLNTLKISEQMVFTALEKIKNNENLADKRGTHANRPHKMNELTKKSIMDHIQLFPAKESHYLRKQTKRQYLSENLNISKMYRLYKDWFGNQEYSSDKLASKRQYESIFNTEFNYSFFKPKKDLCGTCSLYDQADMEKKVTLQENYNKHIARKEKVRQIKEEEKATVDKTNTTVAIFDLEKVLNIPQSEVGIFHYKRKYPVYNFTIFNALTKTGYCYVWHLSIAKRGATEIGSCLLHFIEEESRRGIKNISFYSDGCAGQNKNRYIFSLYLYALKKYNLENITHRFYETGHSQNEGDSMHSCVERSMKNKVLYTPDQVYSIILNAKVTGEKYRVKEMGQNDFYNIKDLILGKNWAKDTDGKKIAWNKVMEVKVSYSKPDIVQLKYDFEDEYFELKTKLSRRGRRPTTMIMDDSSLKQMYYSPITVKKALLADLNSLCRTGAIPEHYHAFYNTLRSSEVENQDETSDPDQDHEANNDPDTE